MASAQHIFRDGGSNNKPPCFVGEYYDFWKIRMKAYLEAQGEEIWNAVENGPFIPTTVTNNVEEIKVKGSWTDDDKKKVLFDKKAINILQSALGMDEFFRISHCKTAKEIWDTLEVTHEGTVEVKRSKLNTLSQEYEMFRMQPGEKILDLQKRFSHLTNHLMALGKTFSNDELNLKILRSLTREWQPKVTAISEKKSLSKMTSATLFGKLQEHEIELGRLEKHEVQEKKNKSLALKTKARDYDSDDEESQLESEDDVEALFKKFKEFLKRDKLKKVDQGKKFNGESTSRQKVTCFECGNQGHIKNECPSLQKKNGFKSKKFKKPKRAYIAWDDNEVSSSSDSESEEYANLALMASHHSDDEDEEVSSRSSSYENDYQSAINELLNECKILYKKVSTQKKTIQSLEEKIDTMETNFEIEKQSFLEKEKQNFEVEKQNLLEKEKQNFTCKKCDSLSFQIVQLKRVLERYEKGQVGLDNILRQQRRSNDKSGLGYSKFDKLSTSKTIFVKAIDQSNKEKVNKAQKVNHRPKKRLPKKKSYVPRYRSNFVPTCFYCGISGHTPNACYVRNFSVPSGHYVWVKKGTNYEGPKATWVPNKT
ncbi:gag-protease polyprotein [Trifolium repens]|nr:gag-protease polyprotein [Trifolium repens]